MKNSIQKIAVFRALHLGDLLCSMPAIRLLRQCFPEAEISLVGLESSAGLVSRYKECIDELIVFPGHPGLPESITDPQTVLDFIREMRSRRFDLLVQMQGDGQIINQLLLFCGARYLWAFHRAGAEEPLRLSRTSPHRAGWPEICWMAYPAHLHEIHRHLSLVHFAMAGLGIDMTGNTGQGEDRLFFPLSAGDYQQYRALRLPLQPQGFVVIHAGSRAAGRRWPAACFAQVARYCLDSGFKVVLTGTDSERPVVQKLQDLLPADTLNLAGATGLGALGVLIENAALVFSNCTGISHITAALQKDAIIISMDGEPERWGPLDRSKIYTHDWLRNPQTAPIFSALEKKLSGLRPANSAPVVKNDTRLTG